MLRYLLAPFRFVRRRPRTALAAGVVLCAAAVAAVHLWAWHHFRAAEQALRDDDLDEARQHVAQCLRVWGRGSAPHLLAARIERMSGHYPEAEQHLAECARLQHGPTEATQLEQVMVRAQAGDLKEVEAALWKCVAAGHPETARILEALAQGYMSESRMGMAVACLDQLLEREPQSPRAWHWRGWVHERLNHPEQAIADYRRAVALSPARWGVRLRLVRLLLEKNGPAEALPHLDELQRTHADDPDVRVAVAQCRYLQGKGEEAIRLLDGTLATHPHHFEALSLRGLLACEHEPPAVAESWLRRALRERAADPNTLYLLYQSLDKQGKDSEATRTLDRYRALEADGRRLTQLWNREIERSPHNPDLLAEVGAILLRFGEDQKGLDFLYRALGEDADHRAAHEALLRYYEAKGDTRKAAEHRDRLRQVKKQAPTGR